MSDIDVKLKMGDGTRSGTVRLDDATRVSELLKMVMEKWSLASDGVYEIFNETRGNAALQHSGSLVDQGVRAGDELAISAQAVGG